MKMKLNSDFYVLMLIKNYKQLENKHTNKMNVQIIRQTEDRHTDSVMIGIMTEREHWTKKRGREKGKKGEREGEGETDWKIVRKTPWNDVHISLNNITVNKSSHFMPFQKYRVWQVHLNDRTVFVQLAPPLKQLLSTKLHSSKSESNTKTFLRGLEEWVTSKDNKSFWTFFLYF